MVELIRVAAPLHDVGKIGLPDSILGKAGRLTDDEVRLMRTHAAMGANILAGARTPVMEVARTVALTHHERWDGSGYPRGLSGGSIPLAGRIVAVADVFDALTRARVYKRAWTPQEALDAIRRDAGIHFDPVVVAAFFALIERGEVSVLGRRVRPPRAFSVAY
jgi:putative two-component system response regulator